MMSDLTICPDCGQAALEWKDEAETIIRCPVCGSEWGGATSMYRSEDVREALRIAVQRGNDTAAWNSGMDRKQVVEEAEALFEELVPVERCEHGHYDPHPVVPVGGDWYQCPGAGIGDTNEYDTPEPDPQPVSQAWLDRVSQMRSVEPGAGIGGSDDE